MWILQKKLSITTIFDKNVPWHSMQYKSLPDIYIQTVTGSP